MKKWYLVLILILLILSGVANGESNNLVVYTYSSFPVTLIEETKWVFQTHHGINVDYRAFSDTGPLFNQLLREKNAPFADVVIGLDNNYFVKAVEADLFLAYKPKNADKIRKELLFDRGFRMTPFDYGYVLFNYDSEKLTRVPKTHQELTEPYYKGKIIIENPMTSSPGQVFLLTTIALFGEEGYLDYWRQLKENILAITPGWDEAYGIYTSGEAPIVLSYGTSPVYHLLYEQTERYKALVLDGAAYAQIEGAGLVKGTQNIEGAQKLMDYFLSVEFQSLIPENQFMLPVRTDVELPESFRIAAKAGKVLNLSQEKVDANMEKWLSEWERVINE